MQATPDTSVIIFSGGQFFYFSTDDKNENKI